MKTKFELIILNNNDVISTSGGYKFMHVKYHKDGFDGEVYIYDVVSGKVDTSSVKHMSNSSSGFHFSDSTVDDDLETLINTSSFNQGPGTYIFDEVTGNPVKCAGEDHEHYGN